jgi:hypothetical protein
MLLPARHAGNILEHKRARPEFDHDSQEMKHQFVARIIQNTLTNQRESLAGRTTENSIDLNTLEMRRTPNVIPGDVGNVGTNDFGLRKIQLVNGAMNWVNLDSGSKIETGLFKTEGQATSASEQFDSNGSVRVFRLGPAFYVHNKAYPESTVE